MSQEIDYAAVLADLEARRSALDAAIAGVKAILGQGPVEGLPTPPEAKTEAQHASEQTEVTAGVFNGLSVSQAIRKYFEMKKTKQRTRDIARAIRQGGIETTARNFYANVFNTLKRSKDFVKLGKYWGLAEWYPTRVSPVPDKPARKLKRIKKVEPTPRRANAKPQNLAVVGPSELAAKIESA